MKNAISFGLSLLFVTFITIVFVNVMSFGQQVSKVNDYHYASVNEIESSDFAQSVINKIESDSKYSTKITEKTVKEDLRIYQVTTKGIIKMPIFGYSREYVKESTAR